MATSWYGKGSYILAMQVLFVIYLQQKTNALAISFTWETVPIKKHFWLLGKAIFMQCCRLKEKNITFSYLEAKWPFICKNINSLQQGMLCAKFGWHSPMVQDKKFLNIFSLSPIFRTKALKGHVDYK